MHRSAFPQGAARPRRLGRFARWAAACAGLLALTLALAASAQAALGAATQEAQARAHSRPRIAVISIELAQQPTL
ncbi:hypothetical protein P3W66_27395, partial [Achromobacter denitrificans]